MSIHICNGCDLNTDLSTFHLLIFKEEGGDRCKVPIKYAN